MTARRALLLLLVCVFVSGAVWAATTGRASPAAIDHWLESLGPVAPAMFIGAFAGGAMMGLPGMVFVVGARLAFEPGAAFALGYGGGLLACLLPFATARRLRRGEADPWRPQQRHLRRALELVETHPLRAIILMRLVLWFNPPLSYALAVTRVSIWVYLAACAIALAPVVAIAVFVVGKLV